MEAATMRLGTGRRHRLPPRGLYPSLGYSIWEGAAAAGGGGGPLLEGDEEAEAWFEDEYDAPEAGSMAGCAPRYERPPAPGSAFCLVEGLPQDALVALSELLAPAELMRLSLASKAMAARVGRGPGGAYPWLQKCLQAWSLPGSTALAQLSPDSCALDFAALYPDIVAWPSDIETDARRPLRRSPSTLALIQGRGHSGAFKVVDFHTVQFAGEGLGLGNRAVRATVPFPSLEDPTNRQPGKGKAGADGDGDDNSMWHRLQRFTRGLHLHLPPPTPSTVVPLSLAASAAAAAAGGSLSATATAAALMSMSSGYYISSTAAAAAAARGPNSNGNGNNGHRVFPASFFPSYLSASLASSSSGGGRGGGGLSGMAGSASALFSASAPASLAAFMAQHMPRVPTTVVSTPSSPARPLSPTAQQLEQLQKQQQETEAEAEAAKPKGPRAFSAPWTRADGALEVRPRLVAYYEVAILPREGSPLPSPTPVLAPLPLAPLPAPVPVPVEEEDEPIFMVDEDEEGDGEENELAVLLNQGQPAAVPVEPQAQPQQQQAAAPEGGEGGNNCVAVGLAGGDFPLEGYMPGWDPTSYAFHSDDGGIFHGTGIKVRYYGPRFGAGDTVGCGLDYARKEIFFTLNGQYLGVAFDGIITHTPLYPTVGIDSRHPVSLNFGESAFAFDLDTYQGLRAAADAGKEEEAAAAASASASAGPTTTHVAPTPGVSVPPPMLP